MPWTKTNYPDSMKNLPAVVREKAIEIANALFHEKKMEEGILIATAISRAKDWAANRGMQIESKRSLTDLKQHGEDVYATPRKDKWAVKREGNKKAEKVFSSKNAAVKLAKSAKASVTIQGKSGKIQKKVSYTPHKHD